jgi:nucleoid DNA-binding protein
MEKYILELITDNNRVIIPNFGAFIISKENGINVLFNNFLSFNDGLLVNYIAEQKGIDTIQATDQVFEYVDMVKKELEDKGEFKIDKLGYFKKDEHGILKFHQAENLEIKPQKETTTETESTKKDETLLDIDKTDEITEVKEEEKIEANTSSNEEKTFTSTEPILTIDKEGETSKEEIKTPLPDTETETTPLTGKETTVFKSDNKDYNRYIKKELRKRKHTDITTVIVIGALLVIGLVIYFLFFNKQSIDKVVLESSNAKTILEQEDKPDAKETIVYQEPEAKLVEEPEIIPEVTPETNAEELQPVSNGFHLIVGGFEIEDNAINMVQNLQNKGFSNTQIIPKGTMFLVSIDSDISYMKMEVLQQEILDNERLESWIYHIK